MLIAIFGAGSWGTALAVALGAQGRDVTLWARRTEAAETMRRTRHNPTYLPDAALPETVCITDDLRAAAEAARLWVVATPSQAVRHDPEVRRLGGLAQVARHADGLRQRSVGKIGGVVARPGHRGGGVRAARPQRDLLFLLCKRHRQRRAPASGSEDGDAHGVRQ